MQKKTPKKASNVSFTPSQIEAGRKLFAHKCDFVLGVAKLEQLPNTGMPEVAFAGRSNVGKSSLMNALLGRKDLVRVSKTPGRTRELNFFNLSGHLMLVDMPGYGFAKVGHAQKDMWEKTLLQYLRGRRQLKRVFVLIDSRRGLMDSDDQIMDLLDEGAVSYQIVLTKRDEKSDEDHLEVLSDNEQLFKNHPALYPEILATSSYDQGGIPELRAVIAQLASG